VSRRTRKLERAEGSQPASATVTPGSAQPFPAQATLAELFPAGSLWSKPWLRRVVSLLLALHLLGIFLAPLASRPEPTSVSALCESLMRWYQPYLDTAYLNHGYGFFSPDPGSSLLIRYEVELPDGGLQQGVLPDRNEHWPRLLYHRHFMLSSQSAMMQGLPEGFARHLLYKYQGRRVKLELVEHVPASPENVLNKRELTDAASYIVRNEATLDAEGNFTSRSLAPLPGELLPPARPIAPGGPTGEQMNQGDFGPPTYRGPLAPPRRPPVGEPSETPGEEIQP